MLDNDNVKLQRKTINKHFNNVWAAFTLISEPPISEPNGEPVGGSADFVTSACVGSVGSCRSRNYQLHSAQSPTGLVCRL